MDIAKYVQNIKGISLKSKDKVTGNKSVIKRCPEYFHRIVSTPIGACTCTHNLLKAGMADFEATFC